MKDDTDSLVPMETRRLAAIMFTDIVVFSHQMGSNEARTLRLLDTHNRIIQQAVDVHHGTVIKTVGDAFLVDFPSVVHAIQCAQQIQAQFHTYNAEQEATAQIHVRIGIHSGDIVQRDGDVFGDGVNVASRLQALAAPDTICISHVVYREVEKKLALGTVVSLGRPKLKNIAQREPVYALLLEKPTGFRQRLQVRRLQLKPWQRPLQVAAVLVVLASAGILGRYFYVPSPAGLPLPDKLSIVVLPFTNMSGDPEQEYFSDGITEDLTSDLSKISGLFVIARNSAFTYKGKAVKVQDVSRELGVRYVLEGSVRKTDNQVRVTAQLVDATTGGHVWSERYDRPLQDIFALQDEIVQQLVANLRVEVLEAELARVRRIPTDNLTAYDYGLRGVESAFRALNDSNKEANVHARQMFEKAIELDPAYAQAYVGLGYTYWLDRLHLWDPTPQVLERWSEVVHKALVLDASLPTAHQSLAWLSLLKRQHEQAIAEAKQAIALDPNSAEGYLALGTILNFAGPPEESIEWIKQAMRLNPRYGPRYLVGLGWAYVIAERYEEALVPLQQALPLMPNNLQLHWALVMCYVELGREEEARASAAEMLRIAPHFSTETSRTFSLNKDPARTEHQLAALHRAGLK
jgi:adenylate cyclase